jgi:hypothetical protein
MGVPKVNIDRLRNLFRKKLEKADSDPEAAYSSLYVLFQEKDSWGNYTDSYEDKMWNCAFLLFSLTLLLPPVAVLAFQYAHWFQPLLVGGLLCAGAAGSCVSVLAKMPELRVSTSSELDAYGRHVFNRIGIGASASLIGCALVGWFPIAIQTHTFADALNACAISSPTTSSAITTLLLLGVPMLLAFSERTLTTFENRVFSGLNKPEIR